MELWWSDTDRGKLKYWEKNRGKPSYWEEDVSQYHLDHYKSHLV
jgi:hypothetical protein